MRFLDLPGAVLKHVRHRPVENAWAACTKSRRVPARRDACPSRFDTYQANGLVGIERMEQPHCVRPATNASDGEVRQPTFLPEHLISSLVADHRLEIAHHHWIRMWTDDRAQQIVRRLDVGHPVADGFVDGVLKVTRSRRDGTHLGTE